MGILLFLLLWDVTEGLSRRNGYFIMKGNVGVDCQSTRNGGNDDVYQ